MAYEEILLQIPPSAQYVSLIRQAVTEMSEQIHMTPQEIADLTLAVGEACTNAVRHGQPDCGNPVRVRCTVAPELLRIQIKNRYCGQAPCCPVGAAPIPEHYREGGMGIFLMKTLVDDVDIRWGKTTATVTLTKNISHHA